MCVENFPGGQVEKAKVWSQYIANVVESETHRRVPVLSMWKILDIERYLSTDIGKALDPSGMDSTCSNQERLPDGLTVEHRASSTLDHSFGRMSPQEHIHPNLRE